MQFSEAWLREWVNPPVSTDELAAQLTMAGLEVGGVAPAAAAFSKVVLGRVLAVEPHPDAQKLRVCTVDTGAGEHRQIVCGAPNVAAGQLVPVAEIGAVLPGNLKIRKAKLRGVVSHGMICSAAELGISEEADGILVLPGDGEPGVSLRDYLALDDTIIDIDLTPNRGDCLGLAGVAREVGVINRVEITPPPADAVPAAHDDILPVELDDSDGCPIFVARIVRGIDAAAVTPSWMQERLRRSGIRPIHPVVDVTNYVMLETGQPMHGYDLRKLDRGIVVRRAASGENLTLLDGRELALDEEVLLIADQSRAIGMAGIMGGEDSGIEDDTTDVLFEAAFFSPLVIAGRARRFGLHTDASHRFERGVEPGGQVAAVERATRLLLDIAGGSAGPVNETVAPQGVPARPAVRLRRKQLARLLGHVVPDSEVEAILTRLQIQLTAADDGWIATPPPFRFDIAIEADLIEEVARIFGYDNLPEQPAADALPVAPATETEVPLERLQDTLVALGYREAVTYSFVDPELHRLVLGDVQPLALANPISTDLSVMRTSLWPGLLGAARLNLSRQQERVFLFESGLRFIPQDNEIKQEKCLAAVACGTRLPEQWGTTPVQTDFFDIKGAVEALLAQTGETFSFEAGTHAALHPAQTAEIRRADGVQTGWVGALHPAHQRRLGLAKPVYLFEILVSAAFRAKIPVFAAVSRYPSLRRDISFLVDEGVTAAQVLNCVREHSSEVLREALIFDIYRDQGIDFGRKSVALGLILQDYCSTLTDGEADAVVEGIRAALVKIFGAKIRD